MPRFNLAPHKDVRDETGACQRAPRLRSRTVNDQKCPEMLRSGSHAGRKPVPFACPTNSHQILTYAGGVRGYLAADLLATIWTSVPLSAFITFTCTMDFAFSSDSTRFAPPSPPLISMNCLPADMPFSRSR
jgi:hypothetical protein